MRNSTPMEVTVMRKGLPVILAAVLILLLPWSAGGATVQKLTLTMRDFKYTPAKVNLQVGVPAEITLINRGKVAHEFMIYDMPRQMSAMMMGHEWAEKTNFFRGHAAVVTGGKTNMRGQDLFEVIVSPGKTATVKFTPARAGTFEFGCMIKGHYEAGQKGTLTIR